MKLDRKTKGNLVAVVLLIVSALLYSRPYSFSEIMPGFNDAPIIKCEAEFYEQEAGEQEKPKYTTIYKEFDVNGEEYSQLMEKLESVSYRKPLAVALTGGAHGTGHSISYPYAIITFYQDGHVYQYRLFNSCLPAGPVDGIQDYIPQGGRAFHEEVIEFIRTHGTTVNEEVKQY